jgi:hypothetical protein
MEPAGRDSGFGVTAPLNLGAERKDSGRSDPFIPLTREAEHGEAKRFS